MQLRQIANKLDESNVKVAVVTFDDTPLARAYVEQTQLAWPLLLDTKRELYTAYGMGKASWWTLYNPIILLRYVKLILSGREVGTPGKDWSQLGGDILVDPHGIVRMHFVSESPMDRPTPNQILEIVNSPSGT